MRVSQVRISGLKPIPFCAEYTSPPPRSRDPVDLVWHDDIFEVTFATPSDTAPMLNAIIGPNSSGKSTILLALSLFLNDTTRLKDIEFFNRKQSDRPIVIEVTFTGAIVEPNEWQQEHCTEEGQAFELTLAKVWEHDTTRVSLLRHPDGHYYKAGTNDRRELESLLPEYRLITADHRLGDEANIKKNNLINDLVSDLLSRKVSNRSIIHKIRQATNRLEELVERADPPNAAAWREIEKLEKSLSAGLASITPRQSNVRFQLHDTIPSLQDLFFGSNVYIDDGVELDFDQHGLGLQRSFVVSALQSWCEFIRDAEKDYLFAIEEPEIYLHPHATRVLLNTLERLAENDQVIFTTHSSEFVNRVPLQNMRAIVRSQGNGDYPSKIIQPDLSELNLRELVKVQRQLRQERSDMLFARAVLLVEGLSDLLALPALARTLSFDIDRQGISIVCVYGKDNFMIYDRILRTFGIPYVILADGDGEKTERKQKYRELADDVFVFEQDLEHDIVNSLMDDRLQMIVNECFRRIGEDAPTLEPNMSTDQKVKILLSQPEKPLVARVIGEMLTTDELNGLEPIPQALKSTVELVN